MNETASKTTTEISWGSNYQTQTSEEIKILFLYKSNINSSFEMASASGYQKRKRKRIVHQLQSCLVLTHWRKHCSQPRNPLAHPTMDLFSKNQCIFPPPTKWNGPSLPSTLHMKEDHIASLSHPNLEGKELRLTGAPKGPRLEKFHLAMQPWINPLRLLIPRLAKLIPSKFSFNWHRRGRYPR